VNEEGIAVHVKWIANPFHGDRFEEVWLPAAEAVLDYGGTGWALFRTKDGLLDFLQLAFVPTKDHWDRYWYSDEIGEVRAAAVGLHQVPVLPTYHNIAGMGSLAPPLAGTPADAVSDGT
jgi:hypothetical protein